MAQVKSSAWAGVIPVIVMAGADWARGRLWPAPAVMAACLSRRIGIEVMDNAAAARTYNVLSSERRNVLLGMILPGSGSNDAPA